MDDLKNRIKALLEEIEYVHLKKTWAERLIASGFNENDALQWAVEIGQVVDEYQRSLRYLVDFLEENDKETIAEQIYGWAAYTRDISIFKIEDIMRYLQEQLEPYRSPASNDDEVIP